MVELSESLDQLGTPGYVLMISFWVRRTAL